MKSAVLFLALCFGCQLLAFAADAVWHGPDGKLLPDTAFRKSQNGFGAWLVITSDEDWEAKWNTPPNTVPQFTTAQSVKRGGELTILIFFENPKTDQGSAVNVRCDIKVTRPDGTQSINAKDLVCMEGELKGSPYYVHLAAPVIKFVGEPKDPIGEWRVEVSVKDVFRATSLQLRTSFKLQQ